MLDFTTEESKLELKQKLAAQSVLVTFTKVDGSERTMLCTLNPSALPPTESTSNTKSSRTTPSTALAVYDIESQGWRSFRWDSILKVSEP